MAMLLIPVEVDFPTVQMVRKKLHFSASLTDLGEPSG